MSTTPQGSPRPAPRCPACGQDLQRIGEAPVQASGSVTGWQVSFMAVTDTSQAPAALTVYRCGTCGRIELYDHGFQLAKP